MIIINKKLCDISLLLLKERKIWKEGAGERKRMHRRKKPSRLSTGYFQLYFAENCAHVAVKNRSNSESLDDTMIIL